MEKQIQNEEINFDFSWYADDPENEIIIGDKRDNVYLLIEGFIKSPKIGNVVFQATSDDGVIIDIAGQTQLKNEEGNVAVAWKGQAMTPYTTNKIYMKKDKFYKLLSQKYNLEIPKNIEACPLELAPTSSTTVTIVLGDALAVAMLKKRNF